MSVDDERRAGAIEAARALSWGTLKDADSVDVMAIAVDGMDALAIHLLGADFAPSDLTPSHIDGAAQFFRELADALDERATKGSHESA